MRHDEALALYNAGQKAVTKILCDLSNTIEFQQEQITFIQPIRIYLLNFIYVISQLTTHVPTIPVRVSCKRIFLR